MFARRTSLSVFAALTLASLATGCGGAPAMRTPGAGGTQPGGAVVVDGDRPGRPGCLDCIIRVCSTGGAVDTVLLELDPPAGYSNVTFTSAEFHVTTPTGVTYGTTVDPATVGDPPISLEPKDFPTMTTTVVWTGSTPEVAVKYQDKNGVVDGETWPLTLKTDGCDP